MRTKRRVLKKRTARRMKDRVDRLKAYIELLETRVLMHRRDAELARVARIEPLRDGRAIHVLVDEGPEIIRSINARGDEILRRRHEYITLTAIPQFAVTINAREIRESRNRYITVEALRRIADAFRDEILKSLTEQSTAHGLLR